jgi:hypothetical protein
LPVRQIAHWQYAFLVRLAHRDEPRIQGR